jgi:hypothetical protein
MTSRTIAVLTLPLLLGSASAADGVQPRAGVLLGGMIEFPASSE